MVLATRHTDNINLADDGQVPRRTPIIRSFEPLGSQRDREMRDVYFESRGQNTPRSDTAKSFDLNF